MKVMKVAGHRATPLWQWFPGAGLWGIVTNSTMFNGELNVKCMDGKFLRQFCDHDWYSLPTGNDNAAITFPVDLKTGKMFFDLPNTAHHTLDGQHPRCMVKTLQFHVRSQIYNDYRISTSIFTKNIPRKQHLSSRSFFNSFKLPLIIITTSPWKA